MLRDHCNSSPTADRFVPRRDTLRPSALTQQLERTMATRKPKNPDLAAAASSLADAVHHIGQAFVKKIDEIGTYVSAELDKARKAALTKRGQTGRKVDALLKSAEGKLRKAVGEATKSLHRTVREGEKKLTTTKKAPAKKAVARKTAARKAPAKKAPARRRAA
jgi:hypothetical protein